MKMRKALAAVFFAAVMIMSLTVTVSAADKKIHSASKDDLIGRWYYVDGRGSLYFYKSGKVKVTLDGKSETYKYTLKNGLLKVTDGNDTERYAVVINNGMPEIAGFDDDVTYKAYKSGQTLDEYYYDTLKSTDDLLIFSKKKPVPANQEDILGTWVASSRTYEGTEELGIAVFNKKNTLIITADGDADTEPIIIKNGKVTPTGKLPNYVSYEPSDKVYLCEGRLYQYDSGDINVYEKYKAKKLTDKILEDAYCDNGYFTMYFKDGKLRFKELKEISGGKYTIKDNGDLVINSDGQKMTFKPYITDNYIYLVNDETTVVFTRKK